MTDELRKEIEYLKAEIAALKDERLPRVDRASRRRDRRQVLGGFGMFAVAMLLAGTMSASALAGSNTVTTGDIVDGDVHNSDLGADSVTAGKVKNGALAGADIKDGSLTGNDLALDLIYKTTAAVSIGPANSVGGATATCNGSDMVVGGGFTQDGNNSLRILDSSRTDVDRWTVRAVNSAAESRTLTVQAVCAKLHFTPPLPIPG